MPKPFLSVIIPAYNESKRLPLTLIDVERHLAEAEYSWEIVVVNGGSSDATAEITNRFSHLIPNLRLLDYQENHGKGWAVREGMLQAHGNWRLFMDADNATSVDQFVNMMPFFKEGYDVVIGSRTVKGAKLEPAQPFYKQLFGKMGNLFIQGLVLPGIWDTQCGFKCFSEAAATRVFKLSRIDRWGFDVEALVLARLMRFRIKEVPVHWVNDPDSKVTLGGYFSTLWDVVRIKLWLTRHKYNLAIS